MRIDSLIRSTPGLVKPFDLSSMNVDQDDTADLIVYVEHKHGFCESRNVPREVVFV